MTLLVWLEVESMKSIEDHKHNLRQKGVACPGMELRKWGILLHLEKSNRDAERLLVYQL